jgi:DNA invertase Pin-like site-specific DNA recombinase
MAAGQRIWYCRVSSVDQSTERQLDGVEVDRTFTDRASGKSTERPQLQEALRYLRQGDTLVVHSPERLARTAEDLLRLVRELNTKGVGVEFIRSRLHFSGDARDPMSVLMLTMLGGSPSSSATSFASASVRALLWPSRKASTRAVSAL